MSMLWKFAWRNIWRNQARTALLLASMSIGLCGVLLMMGFVRGWIDSMRDAAVDTYAGHVKIMAEGFFQNPSVDRTLEVDAALRSELHNATLACSERIGLQGMLQTPRHTRIVQLVGIHPDTEATVSILADSLVEGDALEEESEGQVLIGRRLAERLDLKVGSKVVLTVAQRGGEIGAAAARIRGLFDTGQSGFDESHVYLPIEDAATLYNISNQVTEVVFKLPDMATSSSFAEELEAVVLPEGYEAMAWTEQLPLVTESMKYVDKTMFIYYLVFFAAMAFGIVNTLLMSIGERTREIGMMMAVGMRRKRVVGMVLMESCMIGVLAVMGGSLLGWGILFYYGETGIDLSALAEGAAYAQMGRMLYPTALPGDFVTGAWITLIITLIFSLYPAWRASRLLPVEALRQR